MTTPFLLWVAIQTGDGTVIAAATLGPSCLAFAYWHQYENWQLVLEADYETGTLFTGRWLEEQASTRFDLRDLREAFHHSKEVEVWDDEGRGTVTEHYFTLRLSDPDRTLTVGIGSDAKVAQLVNVVEHWRARVQHNSRV